jgi:hypothetical protein
MRQPLRLARQSRCAGRSLRGDARSRFDVFRRRSAWRCTRSDLIATRSFWCPACTAPATCTISRSGLYANGDPVAAVCARQNDALIDQHRRQHQRGEGVDFLEHAQPELCREGGRQRPFVGSPAAWGAPCLLQTRPRRREFAALRRPQCRRKLYQTAPMRLRRQRLSPLRSLINTCSK